MDNTAAAGAATVNPILDSAGGGGVVGGWDVGGGGGDSGGNSDGGDLHAPLPSPLRRKVKPVPSPAPR